MSTDREMISEEEYLDPEKAREKRRRQTIQEKNFELLKELEHRQIEIRSNRYEHQDREYYVEKVERAFIDGNRGYIPSVRLINETVRPSLQPSLKMPRELIPVKEEGNTRTLHLIYSHQPSVEHSFHYMNRHERPDLEIYISYEI